MMQASLTAARASVGKDECQVRVSGVEREYRMGTEIGRLASHGFQGTAGDSSNPKGGGMGAGYVNLTRKYQMQQMKVGHEEEGSSSNCSELAAFV